MGRVELFLGKADVPEAYPLGKGAGVRQEVEPRGYPPPGERAHAVTSLLALDFLVCVDPPKSLPKRQGCWLLPGRAWQGGPHLPHKLNMRKLYLVATQVSFYDSLGGFFPLLKPLVQAVFPAPAWAQLCSGGSGREGV